MRKVSACVLACSMIVIGGCKDGLVAPGGTTADQSIAADQGSAAMQGGAAGEGAALSKGPPMSATVKFGNDVGSPFPPDSGHDASDHARDNMVQEHTVISAGGTVTFNIGPFHRVAIYEPGTKPSDIDVTSTVNLTTPFFIPDFVINDANGRIAEAWANPSELHTTPTTWDYTFTQPGKYLIICTTLPHFEESKMYGWVDVK